MFDTTKKFLVFKRGGRVAGPYRPQELAEALQNEELSTHSAIALVPEKLAEQKFGRKLDFRTPKETARRAERSSKKVARLTGFAIFGAFLLTTLVVSNRRWPSVCENFRKPSPNVLLPSDPLKGARLKLGLGDYQGALRDYDAYRRETSDDRDFDYLADYAGALMYRDGPTELAHRLLQQAARNASTEGKRAYAHAWLGYYALARQENLDRAEHDLLLGLKHGSDDRFLFNLARVYLLQKRYRESLALLDILRQGFANHWYVSLYRGRVLGLLGDTEGALSAFREVVWMNPERWLGHIYLMLYLHQLGRDEEARRQLRVMLATDPDFEWCDLVPYGIFQEAPNYVEYRAVVAEVLGSLHDDWGTLALRYLEYLGKGARGIFPADAYRDATVANASALLHMRSLLSSPTTVSDSLGTSARALPPETGRYGLVLKGLALQRLGAGESALPILLEASRIGNASQSPLPWLALHGLYRQLGREAEAERALATVRVFFPRYSPAHSRIALMPLAE